MRRLPTLLLCLPLLACNGSTDTTPIPDPEASVTPAPVTPAPIPAQPTLEPPAQDQPPPAPTQPPRAAPIPTEPSPATATATTPAPAPTAPVRHGCGNAPTSAELPTLVAGGNAFGLDLWKVVAAEHQGNLAIAPASLGVALGMTELGARGATDDAMRKVLHLTLTGDALLGAYEALLDSWCRDDAPYQLAVANRLFGQDGLSFAPVFMKATASAFGAPMELVDFRHAFEPARLRINAWVAEQTADRIRDLLPPASLDENTRLVLTNALYFKGQWAARFDPARTTKGPFHAPSGDVVADLMHQTGKFGVGQLAGAQVLDLPYAGGDQVMTVVLPEDLAAFEARLSGADLPQLFAPRPARGKVAVTLPRFRLAGDTIGLKPALVTLGMGAAFSHDADFSGMTTDEKLSISDVFHKVFIEVNEEGTEAAAATAVVMARGLSTPVEFKANRPFLFFLRDAHTGAVLFMGRVTDPTT